MVAALGLALIQLDDTYLLPIPKEDPVKVGMGITNLRTLAPATPADIAAAADGIRYVLVGESHNSPDHHRFQADRMERGLKSALHDPKLKPS